MEKPGNSSGQRKREPRSRRQREAISRRKFLKLAVGTAGAAGAAGLAAVISENLKTSEKPKSLKEEVMSFSWLDVENPDKLNKFTHRLADEYIAVTGTARVTKEDLTGQGKTSFFKSKSAYTAAANIIDREYRPTATQFGYTDFKTGKTFIDLETLKRLALQQPDMTAGMAIIDALWHEWGHKDVTPRIEGKLLNDQRYVFLSSNSGQSEPFRSYRGLEVFTDTYYGFLRMEEALLETITTRLMFEKVGLEGIMSAGDYFSNGVDILLPFTKSIMTVDELYQKRASSDFEGLAEIFGANLPGTGDNLAKGSQLYLAIHQDNPQLLSQTGIFQKARPIKQ